MTEVEKAIRTAAQAGRLREYVRQHGETGLGGLVRLADRLSAEANTALTEWAAGRCNVPADQ